MKRKNSAIIVMLLLLAMLTGCGPDAQPHEPNITESTLQQAPTTDPASDTSTEPSGTEPVPTEKENEVPVETEPTLPTETAPEESTQPTQPDPVEPTPTEPTVPVKPQPTTPAEPTEPEKPKPTDPPVTTVPPTEPAPSEPEVHHHVYTDKVVKPTCTKGGYTVHTTIADMELPEPIENGEDPFGGISLFAYNYNKIPEEMLDNSILRALAYTGYDVAYLKSIKKLYNKSYIASSLLENAPDVLSGIGYSSDGSGSGLQTVTDKSTPTGKAPNIDYFKNETGLDCADFVAYYICNYLPNIEGVDISMLNEMKDKYGYRQDDMRFWMSACEDLAKQGRCDAYLLDSDDYENNSADYQNAIENCVPGDLIRFGTSTKDWVHYAIYAGTYDGEDYIIHVGNKRGPEISLVRYMASSSSKSSVPLAFYHFEWNDTDKYGAIEVNKKDPNGKALAGAEFTAVHKETGTKYLIGPTNSSGYAKTEKVLYGEYTVTETKFPSGYQSSGTSSWNVTVNNTTPTVTINATNKLITGGIGIKKTDDTGKALSGVQFGVYSNSGCTTSVGTITTNSSGVATMTGLTPGTTYYLKEKAAPTGHVYNGTVYSVKVVANTTTYANNGNPVVNTRMGKIQIIKNDKNGSLGAGYVFNIYSDENCTTKAASITTNSSGVATSGWLTPGTYYVKEASVPSTDTTHTVNTTRFVVTVKTGETTKLTVTNPMKQGKVAVLKNDGSGKPMEGVLFAIYYDAECTKMASSPFQTNAEGVATVTLDIGSYYVQEYEALDGYIVDKTVYPVTVVADKTAYINGGEPVVNIQMGKLQIIKKDKNGTLGAGYVFTVCSDADCTKKVTTITTASNGIAVSGWLAPGIYYIQETAAPDGDNIHDLSTIRYKVTVNSGETAELTVTNPYKQGTIGVLKTDDAGTPMLFNILSFMSNQLLGIGNTVASIDELYLFLSNMMTIEYIRNAMKRVRKKDSAMILASQNIEDFLIPSIREFTKPMFSIPTHQFLFNAGQINPAEFQDALQVEPSEFELIKYPERGTNLFRCGNERYMLQVDAPKYKAALFGKAGGR